MDDRKMEVIVQLMDELKEMMGHSTDEIGERLGRPKAVAVEMTAEPEMDEEMPMDDEMMEEGPEEKLKARLLKMRG